MNKNVTENELILYCYEELDQKRANEIAEIIQQNSKIRQQYQALTQTMRMLDSAKLNPSQTSVDIIREHSGNYSSLETS